MDSGTGRTFSAVITEGGECLGGLGPFAVDNPWWAEVEPVVARVRQELGVPVTVLRLIDVENGEGARDGHVTYHMEAARRPPAGRLTPVPIDHDGLVAPAVGRAGWATRAGLHEAISWAEAALRRLGRPACGPVIQVRTWNLSGLFRIPTGSGPVWLKTTPPFAARESTVIGAFAAAAPRLMPGLVAADVPGGRVLLEHVPGDDCWDPSAAAIRAAVGGLARAQAALAQDPGAIPTGLPDRTPRALIDQVRRLLDGEARDELTQGERTAAGELAARLPDLIDELDTCGLPITLVHGDFHPGNWRSDGQRTVVVDFADSHLGHPVLDGLRPRGFLPDCAWQHVAQTWTDTWSECCPGSDPRRALAVAAPLCHLSYAVRYQEFLDGIEASERRYHAGDPAQTIRVALDSARDAG